MRKTIDRYFTEHYDDLVILAERNVKAHNRNYDAIDLISHAYEYCIRKAHELTEENISSVVYRVIISSAVWNNSKLNRDMLLTQSPFEGTQDLDLKPIEQEEDLLCEKIKLEKWFNDKKAVLELYRRKIATDKPKLILLDKMIKLRTRNHRTLAEVYSMPHTTMYLMIREIQEEIIDFEDEINNYDKKNN